MKIIIIFLSLLSCISNAQIVGGNVPSTRSLTINGISYNLSANRTWTVGDILSTSSYSNPSWINALAWSKITGTPTTLSGYGITDAVPYSGATNSINIGNNTFSNTAITSNSTGILGLNPTSNTSAISGTMWNSSTNGITFNLAVQALSVSPYAVTIQSGTHSLVALPTNDSQYGGSWWGTADNSALLLGANFNGGNTPVMSISPQTTGAAQAVVINPPVGTYTGVASLRINQGGGTNILEVGTTAGANYFKVANGGASTFSTTLLVTGILTPSAGIAGVTTTVAATAGNVGETKSVYIASGSAVTFTTATATNVATLSLTAGDWLVDGQLTFVETTSTVSERIAGINSTSATLPVDGSESYCGTQSTVTSEKNTTGLSGKRITVGSTTTIYLVGKPTFSAGTCTGYGFINATRIR